MKYKVSIDAPVNEIRSHSLLFHRHSFVRLKHQNLISFTLWRADTPIAQIHFERQGHVLVSLPFAPFGGVDSDPSVKANDMGLFLKEIWVYATKDPTIRKLSITLFPEIHNSYSFRLQKEVLLKFGFEVKEKTLIQYLKITPGNFRAGIQPDKKRYLNKSSGFTFKQIHADELQNIYRFIFQGRKAKQYSLSVSESDILKQQKALPESLLLFGLFKEAQLIAAAMVVIVNKEILYDFHHEDNVQFRRYSPTVPLLKGIFEYAQNNHYSILDLGGSVSEGEINQGLFAFKKSLGARQDYKLTFTKHLP